MKAKTRPHTTLLLMNGTVHKQNLWFIPSFANGANKKRRRRYYHCPPFNNEIVALLHHMSQQSSLYDVPVYGRLDR